MSYSEQQGPARVPPSMRTPLGRVRNLGAAHSGTADFWRQRLTAVALTLLMIPGIVVVMMVLGRNQVGAAQVLGSPWVGLIVLLFILASAWHMKIGMQIVIEDYVHDEGAKMLFLLANTVFAFGVAAIAIFAVLKLSFGA